jgi:ferredoxin/flavodoxin---NADP+ reductase
VSMVRDFANRDAPPGRLLILHSAASPVELGYSDELSAVPWLAYVRTVSRPWLFPGWTGERGRVEDILRKYADAAFVPGDTTVYACGNPQMIRNVQGVIERAGFPRAAFREETFWPPGHPQAA